MKKFTLLAVLTVQSLVFSAFAEEAVAPSADASQQDQNKIKVEQSKKRREGRKAQRARREMMKERNSDY